MADIFDYIKWRADVPMSVDPFNLVDNLILSELSYSDFADVIGPGESMTVEEASVKYFEVHTEEEIMAKNSYTKRAPFLLKEMANNARFGGTVIFNVIDELNPENTEQMAANAFKLPDGTIYIAYRGTDGTVTGWKEDCLLCYMSGTTGQKDAIKYLNENFNDCNNLLRIGGHSKGGNFAVYAASHADEKIVNRIIKVYSNDGPGFLPDDVIATEGYKKIVSKVSSVIPEESIVGMLLENEYTDIHIAKSTAKGIVQHDAFTWQVERNGFEEVEEISDNSLFIKSIVNGWLNDVSEEERAMFVTSLFSFFEVTGNENFDELGDEKLKTASAMYKNLKEMPEVEKKLFFKNLGKFAENYGENMVGNLKSSASGFVNKVRRSEPKKELSDIMEETEDMYLEDSSMEDFQTALMAARPCKEEQSGTREKKKTSEMLKKAVGKLKVKSDKAEKDLKEEKTEERTDLKMANDNDENIHDNEPEEKLTDNEISVTEEEKKKRFDSLKKAISKVKDRKTAEETESTEPEKDK